MKILCVSYYDKFSRFFIGIEKELKKIIPSTKVEILSLYPSGYFYSLFRSVPSTLVSFLCWFSAYRNKRKYASIIKQKNPIYKGFELNQLIDYQVKLNESISKKSLLLQAIAYIDFIEKKLIIPTDIILLIGDSRLLIEITKTLAEQKKIQVYHIELGPYQTTFFDNKGVNANASIAGYQPVSSKENTHKREKISEFFNRKKDQKYKRLPFYRGFDHILEFFIKNTLLLPPDLKTPNSRSHQIDLSKMPTHIDLSKNIFLLICQVPFDVNLTHHSPFYKNHLEILKDVYKNLPENSILIVREHPLYQKKYTKSFYDFIVKNDNIYMDYHKDFDQALEKSDAVIVNNSTVGLEAIIKGKPVLALGNSYYDRSGICLKLEQKEDLKDLLKKVLLFSADKTKIEDYLYELITNHLIEGHIIDKNLIAAEKIAHKISNLKRSK